jgi:hypothetical protein
MPLRALSEIYLKKKLEVKRLSCGPNVSVPRLLFLLQGFDRGGALECFDSQIRSRICLGLEQGLAHSALSPEGINWLANL